MSKVWMITGSSRGLGLEIARSALEAGELVAATARRAEAVTAALGRSERLLVLDLDVTDRAAASGAVERTVERFGAIDVLVNNAGFGLFGPFEEASEEDVEEQFAVNLSGAMRVTRAVLPHMRRQRSGRIFNISSIAGLTGFPMCSLYTGSKFAMEGWSESLTMELEPLGIQVTAVEPGFFRTDFLAAESVRYIEPRNEEYREAMRGARAWLDGQHGQQVGDPARLARVLLDLAGRDRQPMRLAVGTDAVMRMKERIRRDGEAVAEWQSVSESTDFPV
jgi:NAD(P)-dependent dehydrogenase (short-subunit alcohol dehydrogenase family)